MKKISARERLQEELASALGFSGILSQLSTGLSDGVWMIDREGRTFYANEALRELLRIGDGDLQGRHIHEFIDPDEFAQIQRELGPGSTSKAIIVELAVCQADGDRIWTRMNIIRWRDADGLDRGLVATVQNVSERRAAEEAQALIQSIVMSSDDAIISKTLEGVVTSWNEGAANIFGFTAAEAIGYPITIIIPPDRLSEEADILTRISKGERIRHYETVRQRKDGRLIDVSVTISPIRDRNGEIVGASKVARDITQRKHDEALRGHLAAIVESSDDAIVSKGLDSRVQSWNAGAERIFGYTAEEMIGESITKIIPHERLSEEDDIISRLKRGERVSHFETVRQRKDGRLIDISVTISPIRDSRGVVIGASKIARDITEHKRAERALKESEEALRQLAETLDRRVQERTSELEAALREMEGFTYSVSHDLRAPLRAIVATSRILEEDFGAHVPQAAQALLQRQIVAANKMAELIDDLLRLSRLGRQELSIVPIDLSKLTSEVFQEVGRGNEEHPQAIVQVQEGHRVLGDEVLLRLVLQNLIENSVKFAKPGEPARVEFGREGDAFFVRDYGIGFDNQFVHKIFAPFERLHRDAEYPGTGIGLANVKRIIERHHGHVWAEGQPGEGATFYFTLPSAVDEQ